jgi:hypothetical protein
MEVFDIFWQTMQNNIMLAAKDMCKEYEFNSKYTMLKVFDNGQLTGFCVYHQEGDFRVIDEAHYIGMNKYVFLKMWRFASRGADKLRLYLSKTSDKLDYYQRVFKFKIVGETLTNFTLERVK